MTAGTRVWVQHINAKGGVNGHPVRLIVYDDGADPARHKAQLKDAVERQHVIAFLNNVEAITGSCCVEYINEKRVPVIGIDGQSQWASESPMYFPQLTNGYASIYATLFSLAQRALPAGKTKLGTLVCYEAPTCANFERITAEVAKGLGFEHVYRGKVSIVQPDYTAECLAAQNAGVQALAVLLEPISFSRLTTSCARQGYRPVFTSVPQAFVDRQKDDPSFDGVMAMSNVFPYFQSGTPATDEFQQALTLYGAKVTKGIGPAQGWVAGKLFEKAAATLTEPPTSDALLRGLWVIKNDDLGGVTMPLTFIENQPATQQACWFNLTIKDRSWASPDGFQRHCRPLPRS